MNENRPSRGSQQSTILLSTLSLSTLASIRSGMFLLCFPRQLRFLTIYGISCNIYMRAWKGLSVSLQANFPGAVISCHHCLSHPLGWGEDTAVAECRHSINFRVYTQKENWPGIFERHFLMTSWLQLADVACSKASRGRRAGREDKFITMKSRYNTHRFRDHAYFTW